MKRARILSIGVGMIIGLLIPMLTHAAVTSVNALQTALAAARPGDIIMVQNGTYANATFTLAASGTPSAPITLKAQNPGQAILSSVHIDITGSYWILDGFDVQDLIGGQVCYWKDVGINICGSNNVLRNLRFTSSGGGGVYALIGINGANDTLIAQSTFTDQHGYHCIAVHTDAARTTIRDSRFLNGCGGGALLSLGGSGTLNAPYTTFEHNHVANGLDFQVGEMLRLKSSHVTVRNNFFHNNAGGIAQRNMAYGTFEGNVLIDSYGFQLNDTGHVVRNNYLERSGAEVRGGDHLGPEEEYGCGLEPFHEWASATNLTWDQNTIAPWVASPMSFGWMPGGTDSCGRPTSMRYPPANFVGTNSLFYGPGISRPALEAPVNAPNDTWSNTVIVGNPGYTHSGITVNNSLTVTRDSHGLLTVGAPAGVGYQGSNVPFSPNEVGASWTGGIVAAAPPKNLRLVE